MVSVRAVCSVKPVSSCCIQIPSAQLRLECIASVNELDLTLQPVENSLNGMISARLAAEALVESRSLACLMRAMLAFANWCATTGCNLLILSTRVWQVQLCTGRGCQLPRGRVHGTSEDAVGLPNYRTLRDER